MTKRIRELEKINEVVKAFGKDPLDKERSISGKYKILRRRKIL